MEVNANAELKSQGLPVVPAMEREQRQAAGTRPVAPSAGSAKASLEEEKMREQKRSVSSEQIARAAREVQERLETMGTKLNFSLDENTDNIIIQVTNRESGELVRQIPSEEMLELKAKLENLLGILFDQKV
jgi:flagellar protein FlaG